MKACSHSHQQSNGDYQNSKTISDPRNQSNYTPIDNSYKLKLEMTNKMNKVRNEAMIEYEDHFRKVMEDD